MKLVVEIPDEQYDLILKSHINANSVFVSKECMMYAIKNGKPLNDVLNEIRTEIEQKCDRINSLASVLPYTAHREIQELLCEIMNLCKAESEENE